MAFRNEKQSLGCLKVGLKYSWSFSHFKKKIRTLKCKFRTLNFTVQNFRTLNWEFRTLNRVSYSIPHCAKFSQLVSHGAKIGLGCVKCHSCARRVFCTVRKFLHLGLRCAKFCFWNFAPWHAFSHVGFHHAKFSFSSVQFSYNDHNVFVSTPIWTPFEDLGFWLPKLRNGI